MDGPLRKGQKVFFNLAGERIDGTVVRDQVGRVAVKFLRRLERRQLDALRFGQGQDDPADHRLADRTTALRAMSRILRRTRQLRERNWQDPR